MFWKYNHVFFCCRAQSSMSQLTSVGICIFFSVHNKSGITANVTENLTYLFIYVDKSSKGHFDITNMCRFKNVGWLATPLLTMKVVYEQILNNDVINFFCSIFCNNACLTWHFKHAHLNFKTLKNFRKPFVLHQKKWLTTNQKIKSSNSCRFILISVLGCTTTVT